MATRADFYILHQNGEMELLGCTSNAYDGDFEEAKNEKQYRIAVAQLLKENHSNPGQWYWPWKTSHITDEVFVFKLTPKLFNKKAGVLLSKVNTNDRDDNYLHFAKFKDRYDDKYCGEDGIFNQIFAQRIKLPIMARP